MKIVTDDLRPPRNVDGKEAMIVKMDCGVSVLDVIGYFDLPQLESKTTDTVDVSMPMMIIPHDGSIVLSPYMRWTLDNVSKVMKEGIYSYSVPCDSVFALYVDYLDKTKFRHHSEHFRYIDVQKWTGALVTPTIH